MANDFSVATSIWKCENIKVLQYVKYDATEQNDIAV